MRDAKGTREGETMIVRLPNWISSLENYNQGLVFGGYQGRYGICWARDYRYPSVITEHNTEFGAQSTAIIGTTWGNASEGFVADMQTYADAYNATQQPGREPVRDLSQLNLFVKACHAAAEVGSFDLSTLTVGNFGGSEGDLLGVLAPNVGNLILAAGMPSCGLDLSTLSSAITAI